MGTVCYSSSRYRRSPNDSIDNNNINNQITSDEKENKNKIEKPKESKENKKEKKLKVNSKKGLDIDVIYNDILKIHNNIRKDYNIEKLELNEELTLLAQKYADNYDLSEESNFIIENYQNQPLGINYEIFEGDISEIINICKSWKNESNIKNNKEQNIGTKYNSNAKHFSQIIWKDTKAIGIGYSELNNGNKIFIVYYFPSCILNK